MISNILIGVSIALSASLQPGPLQAFYLAKVAQLGWRRTLPAAFAPLLSDGPIALVSILLINILPPAFRDWLQLGGGILLFYLAWSAFKNWQKDQDPEPEEEGPAPQTIFQAALINLLNPAPYLGWSLIMGPALLTAWSERPILAIALLVSFYFTLISTSMVLIYLIGRTASLGPGVRKSFNLISALLLAGLGSYFLYQAGTRLAASFV
jgi:threonine/homoserine/homoserine lactone efflux protein